MDIMSSKLISKNIKKYRAKVGLSQDQIARKANLPYSTYLKIESGYTANPTIQNLLNIAEALEVGIEQLVKAKKQ